MVFRAPSHFQKDLEKCNAQVMLFVNQISEIVHTIVDQYHGSPNKNIGDAFLVVLAYLLVSGVFAPHRGGKSRRMVGFRSPGHRIFHFFRSLLLC